ncbi:MAG: hypothetical protein H7222_10110 [Methylotenera sp.]|nr:hypothetical protein [Oligoflexia bacterium]
MFKLKALLLEKRSILLINPKFQLVFLGYMPGLALVAIGVFYVANLHFFWKMNQIGVTLQLAPDHAFFTFLNEQKGMMNALFVVTSLVSFVSLILGGTFLSHRVAGPLHRLTQHMNTISENETLTEVKFRKSDFFPELAVSFNRQLRARAADEFSDDSLAS